LTVSYNSVTIINNIIRRRYLKTYKRLEQIIEIIRNEQSVEVNRLIEILSVAPATIRRDLSYLESNGVITRSHGMAHIASHAFPRYAIRTNLFPDEKQLIAKKAASLISEGDHIILDAGTTTLALASEISSMARLNIITNSPAIACELINSPSTVVVSGGFLLTPQLSLTGPDADAYFNQIEAHKMFLGAGGIRSTLGLTVSSSIEGKTKSCMMKASKKVIALLDSSKFHNTSISMFAEFKEIDCIITDKPIEDPSLREELDRLGVEVIIATE
jgi:DeoR/GlpR family transcriptional regulator of sugar metabolism